VTDGAPLAPRLVLVGFMGSGKTTVGGLAAGLLGWRFDDMDTLLERRMGMSVPEAFQAHGEAWFRAQETALAEELAGQREAVVAAGGGAFTVDETRAALRRNALVVWLRCPLEAVLGRVALDGSRPLARDRATIQQLFALREPLYRLADRAVDASAGPPDSVARDVVAAFTGRGGGEPTTQR
jgi:shikimate kinase